MSTRAEIEFWDERAWKLIGTPREKTTDCRAVTKIFLHGGGSIDDVLYALKRMRMVFEQWHVVPAAGYSAANFIFLMKLWNLEHDMKQVKMDGVTPFDMLYKASPKTFGEWQHYPDSLRLGIGEIWLMHPDEPFTFPSAYLYKVIFGSEDLNWYIVVYGRGAGEVLRGYMDDMLELQKALFKKSEGLNTEISRLEKEKKLPLVLSEFS